MGGVDTRVYNLLVSPRKSRRHSDYHRCTAQSEQCTVHHMAGWFTDSGTVQIPLSSTSCRRKMCDCHNSNSLVYMAMYKHMHAHTHMCMHTQIHTHTL